eukprot:TRINITY_DN1537_c0_g1_i1.p1 TRINITY_DN1537_c0_g1~~TRINITY_DN1537_c0_g1_i1.p1  ORF type:complete len:682 (+),score=174.77 TRINITY_DN1537_c0_g1_i1:109-2154(+)
MMFNSGRVLSRQARFKTKKIEKILIANRGEIACRVIETARSMGVRTVAVHCDAETNGKHVEMADEAFRLGPPPATSSYLLGDKIVKIAKECGAQAIHPGYGFLSENAGFAKTCEENGVEFIGPPASAITSMGSKSESKTIMENANVACVPGYHGEDQTNETLKAKADEMGYPVLIKAVLGGGGKGMRVVRSESEFIDNLEGARREAIAFFKDDRVLIEKFLDISRHIEVQVFCDKHGNGVYLFERDCSVQRRHQKVLEEARAPGLSEELRKEMGEAAVRAAKAVNYVGAGTVEFIFDVTTDKYYFMEMNTRLQVEHPVTEMITGLDLVKLQIEAARGEKLPFTQEDLSIKGHALEARIYAEKPGADFLPGAGLLTHVELPKTSIEGTIVRVDSGFRPGDEVLVHYDPMIAKLIIWAEDRATCLRAMEEALRSYYVVGIPTNIEFLISCIKNKDFMAGGVSTNFIEDNRDSLLTDKGRTIQEYALAAMGVIFSELSKNVNTGSPFSSLSLFRLNTGYNKSIKFGDAEVSVTIAPSSDEIVVTAGKKSASVKIITAPATVQDSIVLLVDDVRFEYRAIPSEDTIALLTSNGTVTFPLETRTSYDAALSGGGALTAPMPGKITKLSVKVGDSVQPGDDIMVMEAMKMEHKIKANAAGTIETLPVKIDAKVTGGQVLVTINTGEE